MYYEDRETGSIYSARELRQLAHLAGRERGRLDLLPPRFAALPSRTVLLIEEAEAIVANAEETQERS